jgi:hypothetical protein
MNILYTHNISTIKYTLRLLPLENGNKYAKRIKNLALAFLSHLRTGFLLLILTSCNSLFIDEQKSNTAQNNFDLLWKIIDEHYCFFREKGVDWNKVYDDYSCNWNGYSPVSEHLFSTMAQMLEELRDGHVVLDDGAVSRSYNGWHAGFPDNFNISRMTLYRNMDKNTIYLNNGTSFSLLPESIGYLYCSSFSEKFNRDELDKAMSKFKGAKGVIIDVRSNGGGLISEIYLLASKKKKKKTLVGYVRYKEGKGHDDFSEFFTRYIEPGGANQFSGKVVILSNRRVYSAANVFVSVMKSLPQTFVIGDNTGGGGGMPISAELYNGWTVKFSSTPFFNVKKQSIESGVSPDYYITLNKDSRNDNIIEAAKTWILTN